MHFSTFLAASMASLAVAAPQAEVEQAACAGKIHILVARGTGQAQNNGGDLQMITSAVKDQIRGATVSQIKYPASEDFANSIRDGVDNMRAQIKNYANRCPQTGIVLLGYSQGAQVIADLLTGNGISGNTNPLGDGLIKNIAAVVQIADPSQTASIFFNRGTGKDSPGRVFRENAAPYNKYKGKIVEFCTAGDYWCATGEGADAGPIHAAEVGDHKDAAVKFIVNHA